MFFSADKAPALLPRRELKQTEIALDPGCRPHEDMHVHCATQLTPIAAIRSPHILQVSDADALGDEPDYVFGDNAHGSVSTANRCLLCRQPRHTGTSCAAPHGEGVGPLSLR